MKPWVYILTLVAAALLSPAGNAFTPQNPDDQATARFFGSQCPGCSLASLQFDNLRRRAELAKSQITLKPGFYPINQEGIPAKVREAGRSVFSLIILNEDENVYPEYFTHVLGELTEKWAASPDPQARRVAQVAKLYFDRCKGQVLCRAPLKEGAIAGGSGVLIGASGTELWSAGHVFEEPFRQALARRQSQDVQDLVRAGQTFKVIIFDSLGKLVAHPYNNQVRLVYSASSHIVPRANPETKVDTLRFQLSSPIGRGLEVAREIKRGENIYSVGYPACTGCADRYASNDEKLLAGTRFPHPDATAFDHQVTLGQVLALDENLVVTNADANGGMSGGATLDSEGRVVGLNSAVGVKVEAPHFLADRRLRLARPAAWTNDGRS